MDDIERKLLVALVQAQGGTVIVQGDQLAATDGFDVAIQTLTPTTGGALIAIQADVVERGGEADEGSGLDISPGDKPLPTPEWAKRKDH